jgi:HD-GYP domain-containing protein (c-di-GMP phosphodiesterase class II)
MSIFVVVLGVVVSIVLAGVVASMAWHDGREAAIRSGAGAATKAPKAAAPKREAKAELASTSSSADAPTLVPTKKREAAEKARETASPSQRPEDSTILVLFGGFALIGAVMLVTVRRPYGSARDNAEELAQAYRTLQESSLETYAALNATVEAKDRYTAGHGLRVTLISLLIAQEMGLPEEELDVLRHAATFHDIGKIAVPDRVLQKEGKLTPTEFEAMKVHPVESARICSKVAALRPAVPMIRSHHERIDGRGYPDGLAGEEIPLGSRIIAVADAWDAITSDRPYRRGQAATVALDEIRRVAGSQFDRRVVLAFIEVLAKDPWMFGLTPLDVQRAPAAPGQHVEMTSMAAEDLAASIHGLVSDEQGTAREDIDWSHGFDDEDLAA